MGYIFSLLCCARSEPAESARPEQSDAQKKKNLHPLLKETHNTEAKIDLKVEQRDEKAQWEQLKARILLLLE